MIPFQIRTFSRLLILLAAFIAACGGSGTEEQTDGQGIRKPLPLEALPYGTLSAYGFFAEPMVDMNPQPWVHPYQVAAPLWADHAGKARFIVLPEGQTVTVTGDEAWEFPVGTIVIKSFYYTADRRNPEASATLIETRLLIREDDEWTGHTYVWNDDHTEAYRKIAGSRVELSFVDENGQRGMQEYVVPNTNQCKDCHELDDRTGLLGVVTRQMTRTVDRDGASVHQLAWLADRDLFSGTPPTDHPRPLVDPFGEASLEQRARSYLDANCAHCHRDGGNGGPSGLVLLASEMNPTAYGVCKGPVAAGPGSGDRHHDIAPGAPEQSIIIYRMESTDPEIKMPEIPNRLPHKAGIKLVSDWIRQMDIPRCQ